MRPEAVPVAQRPRPVAYYLQEPLKKWLNQCVEEQIFEEVPEGEAVTWCSSLVVQPKPKSNTVNKDKLESHTIRASVDLRVPNQFMERNRITQDLLLKTSCTNFMIVLSSPNLTCGRDTTNSYSIQSPGKLPLLAPRRGTCDQNA